ncbi:XRE family transcriptional regulator [Dehalobacter sp. TBBPA1]|uniref:XRE family transcriptional regulator n=1 Tax=Dehalobacter sp. TBBPA1 TaxID=3235037 RepID=UPI0034A4842D
MLNEKMLAELREYIDKYTSNLIHELNVQETTDYLKAFSADAIQDKELEHFIKKTRKKTFSQLLFSFIDKKEISEPEVYKKAGIDRRHFSKIRSANYRIGKNTVISLALALELNKKEAEELLNAAGYSLSDGDTFDLIIQYFLEKQVYDILTVNQALDYFSLKPLSVILE